LLRLRAPTYTYAMATNNRHSFSSTTSSPLPGAGDPITLIFSRNSMRNATFDCDSASIHYRVETPTEIFKTSRITSIYRWDKNTNEDTLVAEWERNVGADRMKLRRAGMLQDFLPVKDVIKTSYKFPFTTYGLNLTRCHIRTDSHHCSENALSRATTAKNMFGRRELH
jgi:hypothetical protein